MKKIISIILIMTLLFSIFFIVDSNAQELVPEYDATYNNNNGILYANGNDITINTDANGDTVVYWNGGSQVVPSTVTIIGGGKEGTSYEKSNIIMEAGTVSYIYGGGISLDTNQIATVENSNIVVNNGVILKAVVGGGLIYTTVQNSNVTINNGTIAGVQGGGLANAVISGTEYSAGTEDDILNSKCRVINSNVKINGGIIDSTPSNYGLVYGGGQGYSYTENANLIINGGNLSKAYVTPGGSNGYTKYANVEIKDGTIGLFQTINRGETDEVEVLISGGVIEKAYVGGETGDSSVDGTIDKIKFNIIGGKINSLEPGTSGGNVLDIDQNNYQLTYVDGTIVNNNTGGKGTTISYTLNIIENQIDLFQGESKKVNIEIITNPVGYENLFNNQQISWESSDNNIVTITEDGVVTGVNEGNATISAELLNQKDTANVSVSLSNDTIAIILLTIIIIVILGILVFFLINW